MTITLPSYQLARLTGHKGPIHALVYSSGTGQYLLTGSSDRTINLYKPSKASSVPTPQSPNPALIQSYTGAHNHAILSLGVSEDNALFASGGGDKTLFVWDVATARTLRRFGGAGPGSHSGRIECVVFGGAGDSVLVSGSYDATVRMWDMKSNGQRPIMVLDEAKDSVAAVAVGEAELWAGSVDGRVRTYDLRWGMMSVDVVGQPVNSVTPTLQADSILVSTLDSTLRLLDKSDGKLLKSYTHEEYRNTTYRIRSTLGAKDGLVITGGEDGYVCAWDVLTGELVKRCQHVEEQNIGVKGSRTVVGAVAYKKGGDEWASAGGDGTVVVWGAEPRP